MIGVHSLLFSFYCHLLWFSYLFSLRFFNLSFMYSYESRYMVFYASTCQIIYGAVGGEITNSNPPWQCPGDRHVWAVADLKFLIGINCIEDGDHSKRLKLCHSNLHTCLSACLNLFTIAERLAIAWRWRTDPTRHGSRAALQRWAVWLVTLWYDSPKPLSIGVFLLQSTSFNNFGVSTPLLTQTHELQF